MKNRQIAMDRNEAMKRMEREGLDFARYGGMISIYNEIRENGFKRLARYICVNLLDRITRSERIILLT